ncbi:uncharacterized protein PAC_11714 [Phialocephala subalpina]|uniref:Glycosyltransferase family 31 protein n=1 Tax=Phialocephala subalpina TaxID=576137 RepID=A0A1L7XA17_9HELO|nr:uncharacterized protein PAC_11714 [Phialocephala subalpina]
MCDSRVSTMGPRRPLLIVLFLTVFFAIFFVARYGTHDGGHIKKVEEKIEVLIHLGPEKPKDPASPCSEHLGWLEPYQFSYPIKYVARDIIVVPSTTGQRPSLTFIGEPLFDEFTTVDMTQSSTVNIKQCLPPLYLEVPQNNPGPADASNMIFSLQTTTNRLKSTVKHLARWLPHTGARLYVIVIETEELPADDEAISKLEKEFHAQGMNVTIVHPVQPLDTFPQRYFSLVSLMYEARNEKTQWITLIDDDTFFPSMHDLQKEFSRYDPRKPHYLGSLSEDWWAVNHYGLMAFGGASVFLSLPLAQTIHEHNDECKEHPRTTAGDVTVMDCIYRFSSTKLTHLPGLHQIDIHGDLSGFYESGREMLSLHHWKEGLEHLEMHKLHLVSDICDSCFLQRWQFPHETVLTNGFSLSQYPQGHISGQKPGILNTGMGGKDIEKINLEEMEKTWGDDINVLHSLAPTREKLEDGAKVQYKLLDSMMVNSDPEGQGKGDVVRQVYWREGEEEEGGGREMGTVMVLNWKKGERPPPPEG